MSLPETYKVLYSSAQHGGKPEFRDVPLQKPGKDQVLIKIAFAPINPTDIITMENRFYTPDSEDQNETGSEGSGVVVAVGENLEYPFKVGDKVHFLGKSMGQYTLLPTFRVFPILQEDLSMEEAASHWVNPGTVYYMGVVAKEGGHKAAVHTAGSSALGRMLIRYFKYLGITLINIVRREQYVEELEKEGADYVLNSQDPDFAKKLKELAEKENATLAFEAIAGEFTGTIVKALPNGSTCWVYGVLSATNIKVDVLDLFRQKTIKGLVILDYIARMKKEGTYRQWADEFHKLLPTILSSKVQKIFSLEELPQAIEYYHEHSSKGKILLKPN